MNFPAVDTARKIKFLFIDLLNECKQIYWTFTEQIFKEIFFLYDDLFSFF